MNHPRSLYIHIPFCAHVCGYCDFVKAVYHKDLADQVLQRIAEDLKQFADPFDTIYIGGGTPSALDQDQLTLLESLLMPLITSNTEYTMEINPETIDLQKLSTIREMKVNRLSVGVQAIQDNLLSVLTRKHTWQQAVDAIAMMRSLGFDNISIDAMYGIPTQTTDDFAETLNAFIRLDVEHISLYALTIEPNTAFARQNIQPVDNDLEGSFYDLAHRMLTSNGYNHYEVSSYAKRNRKSRHNLAYWHYDDFIGIGPGAASKIGVVRTINTSNIHYYLSKQKLLKEKIILNKEESMFEFLMMNLRLSEGVNIQKFKEAFDVDLLEKYHHAIEAATQKGWLIVDFDTITTTYQGRLFLHDVLVLLMDQ